MELKYSRHTYSYLALRRAVGLIGTLLPFVLMTGGVLVCCGLDVTQESISHFYYTCMRDVFVGALCAIALFMFLLQRLRQVGRLGRASGLSCRSLRRLVSYYGGWLGYLGGESPFWRRSSAVSDPIVLFTFSVHQKGFESYATEVDAERDLQNLRYHHGGLPCRHRHLSQLPEGRRIELQFRILGRDRGPCSVWCFLVHQRPNPVDGQLGAANGFNGRRLTTR